MIPRSNLRQLMNGKLWLDRRVNKELFSSGTNVKCLVRGQMFDSKEQYEVFLDEVYKREKSKAKGGR